MIKSYCPGPFTLYRWHIIPTTINLNQHGLVAIFKARWAINICGCWCMNGNSSRPEGRVEEERVFIIYSSKSWCIPFRELQAYHKQDGLVRKTGSTKCRTCTCVCLSYNKWHHRHGQIYVKHVWSKLTPTYVKHKINSVWLPVRTLGWNSIIMRSFVIYKHKKNKHNIHTCTWPYLHISCMCPCTMI